MTGRSDGSKTDFAKLDGTEISDEAYAESPEIPDDMFDRGVWSLAGRPVVGLGSPHPRIVHDPDVLAGQSAIRDTGVAVEAILRLLGEGTTLADILERHPALSRDDIAAAQSYAADLVARERMMAAE